MRIERIWAMPNKHTFTILPIRELLEEEMTEGVWVDAFAGKNSPATITNDINPAMPTQHHRDALMFVSDLASESADGVLHDPPYSIRQASECYRGFGKVLYTLHPRNMKYWAELKNQYARILRPGGKAITFGWTSMGLGLGRGFSIERILLVPHGGSRNDTIVTVETKLLASSAV